MAGLVPMSATAIVRTFGVADSQYTTLAGNFPQAAKKSSANTSGTLIAPSWILTAAHIGTSASWIIDGTTYTTQTRIAHPGFAGNSNLDQGNDFALFKLTTPVTGVSPVPLYGGSDEFGGLGFINGFGTSGTGDNVGGGGGTHRAATNFIDLAFESDGSGTGAVLVSNTQAGFNNKIIIGSDFDDPADSSSGISQYGHTSTEGMASGGDSGGGLYGELTNGTIVLVGVNSFVSDAYQNPGDSKVEDGIAGNYGDLLGAGRVSAFTSWITANVDESVTILGAPIPEPRTYALLAGLLGLGLAWRRRRTSGGPA
ncbi:MAG: trypsin-like serine protease [Opitutales bacterium]